VGSKLNEQCLTTPTATLPLWTQQGRRKPTTKKRSLGVVQVTASGTFRCAACNCISRRKERARSGIQRTGISTSGTSATRTKVNSKWPKKGITSEEGHSDFPSSKPQQACQSRIDGGGGVGSVRDWNNEQSTGAASRSVSRTGKTSTKAGARRVSPLRGTRDSKFHQPYTADPGQMNVARTIRRASVEHGIVLLWKRGNQATRTNAVSFQCVPDRA